MSENTATPHTFESLAALPRKADVIAIAEEMKVSAEGTRAEISERIVATLTAPPAVDPAPLTPEPSQPEPLVDPAPLTPAPEKPTARSPKLKLSDKARQSLLRRVSSFLGVAEANAEIDNVVAAIESGKQPCITVATGNRRFDLTVYDQKFDLADFTNDVPSGRDGVTMNLARTLASHLLYPRD